MKHSELICSCYEFEIDENICESVRGSEVKTGDFLLTVKGFIAINKIEEGSHKPLLKLAYLDGNFHIYKNHIYYRMKNFNNTQKSICYYCECDKCQKFFKGLEVL